MSEYLKLGQLYYHLIRFINFIIRAFHMFEKVRKFCLKGPESGQSMVEYILVFAGVIVILMVTTRPTGVITNSINSSLDAAVTGVECMTTSICYDPAGCPAACGNGCCEPPNETAVTCSQDCG